ncbi:hypothetical protein SADUNF_Sadunf05G0121400 [Salix dunnii]|uniref:FAF domain-containing protein n=1 Tax=Salix dunnii TaxID=1413687 RepID=A0A835K872_9ROSI|nr:hypothetical protein SADUNF_Sadunf05G0121400 [Salix dunnii]
MKSQNQETSPQTPSSPKQSHLALVLETPEEEKFVNSCDSSSSSYSMAYNVSSPSSSTLIGEYIGIESCLDLKNNEDIFASSSSKTEETNYGSCSREKRNQRWAKKKEFPPPIPLLARTENLPSHMPWVLKRYYTGDGRLILREEKVRHHEYFRAHRCNGRLTLHLVPLDDEVSALPFLVNHERRHDFENDHDLVEESTEMDVNGNDGVENDYCVKNSSGSAGKCLNYSSVRRSSTCIFGVPVPAVRPVHTYSGLKTLLHYSRGPDQNLAHTCYILHSYMIPAPSSLSWTTSPPLIRSLTNSSSYSSCSSALDDLIGTESGVCMNPNIEEETAQMEKLESYRYQHKRKPRYATRKKYPPPIPLLARTGNLPGHMPWILTRHYIDGKLVLVEERVKHHEYLEAHRENGRLVLNIVPLDDEITCSHFRRKSFKTVAVDDEEKYLVTASASLPKSSLKSGKRKSGDLRKCSTYAGRMISDINAHRNASECMSNIHDLGSATFDLANILHKMTTVV